MVVGLAIFGKAQVWFLSSLKITLNFPLWVLPEIFYFMGRKKKKIIGFLGGIGPEATGEFYLSLIKKFQEENLIRSNEDYPQIIINSIPAPELIYENGPEKSLESYIKGSLQM